MQFFSLRFFDPFAFHLLFVDVESVFALVHVAMLVENKRNPGRIPPIRIPQSRCSVQFVFGAFEQHRAVRQGDGHSADCCVFEILLVVAHLDGHSRWLSG